jgi:uncharacterized protein YcbK (DUF882 family)
MEIFNDGDFVHDENDNIYLLYHTGSTGYNYVYVNNKGDSEVLDVNLSRPKVTYIPFPNGETVQYIGPDVIITKNCTITDYTNFYIFDNGTTGERKDVVKVPDFIDNETSYERNQNGITVKVGNFSLDHLIIQENNYRSLMITYINEMTSKLNTYLLSRTAINKLTNTINTDFLLGKTEAINKLANDISTMDIKKMDKTIEIIKRIYKINLTNDSVENKLTLIAAFRWLFKNQHIKHSIADI